MITQNWPTAIAYSIILSIIGVPIFKSIQALARNDIRRLRATSAPPHIDIDSNETFDLSREEVNSSTPMKKPVKTRKRASSVTYDLREVLGQK